MINQLLKNAERAKEIWDKFAAEKPRDEFIKWFHLRPASQNITIVTTHDSRPMRGYHAAKTKLYDVLCCINENLTLQNSDGQPIQWDAIKSKLNTLGFHTKNFFQAGRENREFPYQARMINEMPGNAALKEALGVDNLRFAASEVILQEGTTKSGQRIDIVAHDGAGKVFFFELKAEGNNKNAHLKQAKSYVELYGKGGGKNKEFEDFMKNYPIYHIDSIKEYVGYAVVGYGGKVTRHEPPRNGSAGYLVLSD